ncbi:caspase family protein [Chryseobacterium sp. cx-311]|uniref:caspase family protein n=1 Tax=Marnyiella aurantia TaxID=2758037 RepID=UPI001AE3B9EA|nr:caspase family protein [Marnyiella aurantia]MBP0613662.1 caspase family protein [Marnyiella aurantia]
MKHIISIGINRTEGLTPLGGAVSGAKDLEEWGKSQGYSTTLLVDDAKSITQSEVFDGINKIVTARNCELLIVFFSGHGILKSPSQEVWLLSNAKNNPNESINLTGSIDNARTSGIPYVVFISDACRVLPNEMQFTGNGSVIFPICDDTGQECAVDVLYATRPGNPALEQNSVNNSKRFGLFTQTIVEVLNGAYPELISTKKTGDNLVKFYNLDDLSKDPSYKNLADDAWQINIISSEQLIKTVVAQKASDISISLSQTPDLRIQYQNPKPNLAEFNDQQAKQLLLSIKFLNDIIGKHRGHYPSDQPTTEYVLADSISGSGSKYESFIIEPSVPKDSDPQKEMLKQSKELLLHAKGRVGFETQTGFTVIGTEIKDLVLNGERDLFSEDNMQHVRVYPAPEMRSALLILENGTSVPLAVLPGYVGTLVFEGDQLLTINYTPSRYSEKFKFFEENEAEIDNLRASVASRAGMGYDYSKKIKENFNEQGELKRASDGTGFSKDNGAHPSTSDSGSGTVLLEEYVVNPAAEGAANGFVQGDAVDPSMGLFAAYSYRQEGKMNEIHSIYEKIKEDTSIMTFDVALLAGKLKEELYNTAPFCPMLALGWAYSQHFETLLHPMIMEASRHLVPGLWTTFDIQGTEIITSLFNQKLIP